MTTYRTRRYRRRQRRARLTLLWDRLRPTVFVMLVAAAASCAWYLAHLAGIVA